MKFRPVLLKVNRRTVQTIYVTPLHSDPLGAVPPFFPATLAHSSRRNGEIKARGGLPGAVLCVRTYGGGEGGTEEQRGRGRTGGRSNGVYLKISAKKMRIFTEISPRVAGLLVFLPLVLFCPSQTCRPGDVFGEHWKWEKCGPFLWGFPPSSPPHTAQFVGENRYKKQR